MPNYFPFPTFPTFSVRVSGSFSRLGGMRIRCSGEMTRHAGLIVALIASYSKDDAKLAASRLATSMPMRGRKNETPSLRNRCSG